jgi:hypothetical protein
MYQVRMKPIYNAGGLTALLGDGILPHPASKKSWKRIIIFQNRGGWWRSIVNSS